MPELPEVETLRRGLVPQLQGQRIRRVQLNRADLRVPFPPDLAEMLTGARINSLTRRAKYLLLHLDNQQVLIIHLGMSGQLTIRPQAGYESRVHDHAVLLLEDGKQLIFNDPRRFGLWARAAEETLGAHPFFVHLGPEPLQETFDAQYLQAALSKRSGPIKPVLMDQKLVVGVGNIYACEALFRSRISPLMPANKALKKSGLLVDSIRAVLTEAIASGGSTLRDYVRSSGDIGYFQHHFRVYGRENLPCEACQQPVRRIVQAGRSTFFCAVCQKVSKLSLARSRRA